jgi:hypothetical protein
MPCLETATSRPILDETGKPVYFGWARSPVFKYDKNLIRSPYRRITESERYIIFSPTHLLVFEVLDGGSLGYISITVVSLKDKKRSTQPFIIPFPLGSFNLPPNSESGSVRIQRKKFTINFSAMEGGSRIIKVDIPRFGRHRSLRGEVVLTPPKGAESMVTCSPWRGEKNAFWYSRDSPWYVAEGVMQFGSAELVFIKDKAWGIFDWSRGVRPRSDTRLWAAACGSGGGRQLGFNVGYSTADSRQGTENAFFVDGKLHKLDQVTFHIPLSEWLDPWHFTSNDERLEMTFHPNQERFDRQVMFFHTLSRRQVYGSFSGKVTLDDGSLWEFQDITGFAERRKTRF